MTAAYHYIEDYIGGGHGSMMWPVTLFIVIHTTLAEFGTHTYTVVDLILILLSLVEFLVFYI